MDALFDLNDNDQYQNIISSGPIYFVRLNLILCLVIIYVKDIRFDYIYIYIHINIEIYTHI